jgi:hypothetical protein
MHAPSGAQTRPAGQVVAVQRGMQLPSAGLHTVQSSHVAPSQRSAHVPA